MRTVLALVASLAVACTVNEASTDDSQAKPKKSTTPGATDSDDDGRGTTPEAGAPDPDDALPPFATTGLSNGDLPAGPADVVTLGAPGAIDVSSAAAVFGGRLEIIAERFDVPFAAGGLTRTSSTDGHTFEAAAPIGPQRSTFEASPSLVPIGETTYLYFEAAESLGAPPAILRAPYARGNLGTIETLPAIAGVDAILSWPKFVKLPDDRIGLAFRDATGRPMVAFSGDGTAFSTPELVGPAEGGAMPAIGGFAEGGVAYTYQVQSDAEPMVSMVRVRPRSAATWSAPKPVTTASTNVHDTTLVPRADGSIDLYYIYTSGTEGFSLYRRPLASSGALGKEQRLTRVDVGEPSKPAVLRVNGGLVVQFALITKRASSGEPSEQRLASIVLAEDAP